jgi:molybdopterin-guanine dinucleotide biosynthesis protein A
MSAAAPLHGLVLAGGASTRMRRDKAALDYGGKPQLQRAWALLQAVCTQTFVSVRAAQADDPLRADLPQIVDRLEDHGPIAGIEAAQTRYPQAAWLVLACDLPFLDGATLEHLIAHRDPARLATAFRGSRDGLPEPLCAIYEPRSRAALAAFLDGGGHCPRKFLIGADVRLLEQPDPRALDNINTAEEYTDASRALGGDTAALNLEVRYHAILREQAGCSTERLSTAAGTPAALYEELRARHRFGLSPERLRVAVNAEFADWAVRLRNGDVVVFIPPVAGG